jgi:outer membrane lipase/esterase
MKFRGAASAAPMWAAWLTAGLLLVVSSGVRAQQFNQFVGFGDSSVDSGWYFTHPYSTNATVQALYNAALAAGGGLATTPGGQNNTTILASLFGLTAIPVGEPGGTNYAAGGAVNVDNYPNYVTLAPTVTSQIASYLASVNGVANPNALYLIASGGNDVRAICPGGVCMANATQMAQASAAAITASIAQLHADGARYFIVPIAFGAAPNADTATPTAMVDGIYNRALYGDLAADGINFVPASGKVIADAIAFNQGLFGLINVTPGSSVTHQGGACVNPNPGNGDDNGTIASAWSIVCTTLVAPNAAQTYLFADDLHYSAAGQLIEADYNYSLITAPEEISYLAEAPVKTRTAVVDSIEQQVMVSGGNRGVGTFNAWVTGDISSLSLGTSYNGFPSDPGTPGMVTVGADYSWAPGWLVGGALSVGTTTQSFSLGGNFQQNEYALSGYLAYAGQPLWFDAIASFGGLHYDIDRVVPIGIATIANTGSTNGTNTSLAAEVGYDFHAAWPWQYGAAIVPVKAPPSLTPLNLTYGPVAGIILQHIAVDGFAETDPFAGDASGGFTALSYAGQVRNSAITELGLQVSTDVGLWHPYGKLVWNHELDSDNRLVTAFEPEIAFAPGFSMPAVSLGRDWGSATVGTTYTLGRGMTAYASFNSEFGQSEVTYYGGQIGLNVALGAPSAPIAAKN